MKTLATRSDRVTTHHSFEIKDARGRRIGAIIETYIWTVTPAPEGAMTVYTALEPGVYFSFEPHATRNGNRYGAAQTGRHFGTEAARAAAIAKYLENAQTRAAKSFPKVEG